MQTGCLFSDGGFAPCLPGGMSVFGTLIAPAGLYGLSEVMLFPVVSQLVLAMQRSTRP